MQWNYFALRHGYLKLDPISILTFLLFPAHFFYLNTKNVLQFLLLTLSNFISVQGLILMVLNGDEMGYRKFLFSSLFPPQFAEKTAIKKLSEYSSRISSLSLMVIIMKAYISGSGYETVFSYREPFNLSFLYFLIF